MTTPDEYACWWIVCATGPFAVSPQLAAERHDAGRAVCLGTWEVAEAACARLRTPAVDVVEDARAVA